MNHFIFKTFLVMFSFNYFGDQLLFSDEILIQKDQSLSVEERYGDRIKLLGISVKDPLVLCQMFIAVFFIIVFIQSGLDKIFCRKENIDFFKEHFKSTLLKNYTSISLTIITFLETLSGVVLVYGLYFAFVKKTTLWIFYGLVLCILNLIVLLFGQRLSKDYVGSVDIGVYFILAILGIMSMY
tara:strand:+ start:2213 stop:2761 length:549 start_codon:yes stop_codon:yes gene_type:complete